MLSRISYVSIMMMAIAVLIVVGTADAAAEAPTGYVVLPAAANSADEMFSISSIHECSIRLTSIDCDIQPGQTIHVKKNIGRFITTLNVDLVWGSPDADLSILIYSPSGAQFGPWKDDFDGKIDQRINKDIYNQDGIEQGDWDYYIKNWGTEATHYGV